MIHKKYPYSCVCVYIEAQNGGFNIWSVKPKGMPPCLHTTGYILRIYLYNLIGEET
jgi:hypothetical protein